MNSVNYQTVNILDINIHSLKMVEVVNICQEHISRKTSLLIAVVNVAKIVKCRKDNELRKSLEQANLVLADGLPIVWLSKFICNPLPERIAGIDLMYALLESASAKKYRVFFFGAKEVVVKKVADCVSLKYPGIHIAGYKNGYFSESQEKDIADEIKNSSADILFVGIPTPKKECFLGKWHSYMNVPICHGVGGSFDVIAGVTKRAPQWMQKCGLEWLYRVIQEPRRMWKRYLVTNTIFMLLAAKVIIKSALLRFRSIFTHTANTH